MSNYTTQTAELHAVKVDTRVLNSNKIDTKKLFIDGKEFTWKDNLKHMYYTIEIAQETSGKFVVSSVQITDLLTNEKTEGAAGFVQGSKLSLVVNGNKTDLLEDGWWLMLPKIETSTISQIYINNGIPRKVLLPVLEQGSLVYIKIAEETDTITELYNKTDTIKFDIIFDRLA